MANLLASGSMTDSTNLLRPVPALYNFNAMTNLK